MNITLEQWKELAQLANNASQALSALEDRLTTLMFENHQADNKDESLLCRRLVDRVWEAQQSLYTHAYHPQTEWLGGDSSDPKNFWYREPNALGIVGHIPHLFPREVVGTKKE